MEDKRSALLREAIEIKSRMVRDKVRLVEINKELAAGVTFAPGCKTAHLAMDGVLAKIQLKETVSWNQEKLRVACAAMGTNEFKKAFTFEFKPISATALKAWMADPETKDFWRRLITDARVVKPAAPTVTYEEVSEEEASC